MKKIFLVVLGLLFLLSTLLPTNKVSAARNTLCVGSISGGGSTGNSSDPIEIKETINEPVTFTTSGLSLPQATTYSYQAWIEVGSGIPGNPLFGGSGDSKFPFAATTDASGNLTFTTNVSPGTSINNDNAYTNARISIYRSDRLSEDERICIYPAEIILANTYSEEKCNITIDPDPAQYNQKLTFEVKELEARPLFRPFYSVWVAKIPSSGFFCSASNKSQCQTLPPSGGYEDAYVASNKFEIDGGNPLLPGYYSIQVKSRAGTGFNGLDVDAPVYCVKNDIVVNDANGQPPPEEETLNTIPAYNQPENLNPPCTNVSKETGLCESIKTPFGSIDTDAAGFIRKVLGIILTFAGAIVVLLIIISGYRLMTSQGNPERVQAAREQLTSAIVGLLFIIFSLVILQVITRDIIGLPGFG